MKQFLFLFGLLFILLIFRDEAMLGTKQGLLLWYQTLIPSLLPFILITNALSETNSYHTLASLLKKFFPHRSYEIIAIFLGNLCGYPIGGKIINDFVDNHCIPAERGNQILALSSQASPMFLIGYIHSHLLQFHIPLFIYLFSIYFPVLLYYLIKNIAMPNYPSKRINSHTNFLLSNSFLKSVHIMVTIGIYVIIFSILLLILLPYCKNIISKIVLSFLEITTGLNLLHSISIPYKIKIPLLCSLSSFGGICSAYQIKSVLYYSNANIKKYLFDKILLSTGTFLITFIYLTIFH